MQLKTLGKFFKTWYPSILMMVIIYIFSNFGSTESNAQSGLIVNALKLLFPSLENAEFLVFFVRKSAHFIEYFLLGLFTARALNLTGKKLWFSVLISCLYACFDEYHQTFISGRSGQLSDVILDTIGASFGTLSYFLFASRRSH